MTPPGPEEPATAAEHSLFVSVAWLRGHMRDPDLVVLDAGVAREIDADGRSHYSSGLAEYISAGHIPGAAHADLVRDFSDPGGAGTFTRPTSEQLSEALGRLGVGARSTVVVYDRQQGIWAARLVWILLSHGFTTASVLEGGLRAWLADGGSLDIGDHAPIAMSPPPLTPQPGFFADIDEVRAALRSDGVALVNVLRREVFSGAENPYGRPGHIPGSINLPYAELVDPDTSKVDLERVRDAARALPPGPAVTYCGSGITAAGYALALRAAGRHDVRVYDGSLSEWAADPTNPLHADHLTNESETSP